MVLLAARRDLAARPFRWVVGGWAVAWGAAFAVHAGTSWFWFERGSRWLLDPDGIRGGLDLYVAHPEIQIGPLALVAGAPLVALGSVGKWAALVAAVACGVVVAMMIERVAGVAGRGLVRRQEKDWTVPDATVVGLLALTPNWLQLAVGVTHLDDVLALSFAAVALWLVVRASAHDGSAVGGTARAGRIDGTFAALACAAAIDAKPWALGFAGVLLALPRGTWLRAFTVLTVAASVAWLPFLLHDWSTAHALQFRIANSSFSALRGLGIDSPQTPAWCRSAQLIGGAALAGFGALRGRPATVPAFVVGSRLLLDPGAHLYYNAGLVLATVLLDVAVLRTRRPWLTLCAVGCVVLPSFVALQAAALAPPVAHLRAAYLIVLLVVCVVACVRSQHRHPKSLIPAVAA